MTESVWLDRPPEVGDFVQLISTRRVYTVKRVLPGGKLRLCLRHWPVLEVCPERVRVWNPALSAGMSLPAGAAGLVTEKECERCTDYSMQPGSDI